MTSFPNAVRQFGMAAAQTDCAAPPRRLAPKAYGRTAPPRHRTVVRLWIPATPLFWLLAPFPLLLAPLAYFAPAQFRPANPYAAVLAIGRVLTSISGTVVHVDTPDALVSVRIL
jgi:hypothetical protein